LLAFHVKSLGALRQRRLRICPYPRKQMFVSQDLGPLVRHNDRSPP
jgi:hypothetical protein